MYYRPEYPEIGEGGCGHSFDRNWTNVSHGTALNPVKCTVSISMR